MNGRTIDAIAILAIGAAIMAIVGLALRDKSCLTGLEAVQSELRELRGEVAALKAAAPVRAPVAPPKAPERDINIFNLERR